MDKFPLYRWWKAHEIERIWPETFLKTREKLYVSACSRFLNLNFVSDHAWVLSSGGEGASALLIHSKRTLFPVFNGQTDFYTPTFMKRALKNIDIFALHGIANEVETLEKILSPLGFSARETVDYKLMVLDEIPDVRTVRAIPRNLTLLRPKESDTEKLFPLQAAYEQEEVLPEGAVFDPRVCRLNLAKIIKKEHCLAAEVDGKIVGKINTNAESYSRFQIGGVYVLPDYRRQCIASCMTAAFASYLLSKGKGLNLYVNKKNTAARAVYKSAGFRDLADYRIVYM